MFISTVHYWQVTYMFQPFQISFTFYYLCLPRNSIPGPDHLSTLSTTIELLQLLLPEDSVGVIPDHEDVPMEEEALKRTTEISISDAQMRTFLKYETEDGPLKTLEKRLEVGESFLIVSVNRSAGQSVK